MKKLLLALIGLSMLFTSCSDVNTKGSIIYAERISVDTIVLHNGVRKDSLHLDVYNFSQIKGDGKLWNTKIGGGIVLVPEDDGGYEAIDVAKLNKLERSFADGIYIGVFATFLAVAVLAILFKD